MKGNMRKFVKYGNRKLHEEGSLASYVSMSELGYIVAAGQEISVVDDLTGCDLTAATLARILYDRCRDGYAVRPVYLVSQILEIRRLAAARPLFERSLDVIIGHVCAAALEQHHAQPRIHVWITAAQLGGNGDFFA